MQITSANRDSRFPLGPDFTFHINYTQKEVTIYENYGTACVYRIFLYPWLPTNYEILHQMTSENLSSLYLKLEIDGQRLVQFSLKDMFEAKRWPFVSPLSSQHASAASGINVYFPFCYMKSLRIVYVHDQPFPANLFELTINCTANELRCPVKIYSAVSHHKFPANTELRGFVSPIVGHAHPKTVGSYAVMSKLLRNPVKNGPGASVGCILSCVDLCPGCSKLILDRLFQLHPMVGQSTQSDINFVG